MDARPLALAVSAGLLGLAVGSFLNVCIFRLPRRCMSVARGRSRCPRCRGLIAWYDNVPVASWILLRGRCRRCASPISPRYAAVELLTGSLFAWAALVQVGRTDVDPVHRTIAFLILAYLVSAIIVSTFIDLDFEILPDEINYSGLVLGLAAAAAFPEVLFPGAHVPEWTSFLPAGFRARTTSLLHSLVGAVVGGGVLYSIGVFGTILFRKKVRELKLGSAMGLGDVKYLAFLGAFLGWQGTLLALLAAVVAGTLFGIGKFAATRRLGKVPFGPFLSLGALLALFARPTLVGALRAYLALLDRAG